MQLPHNHEEPAEGKAASKPQMGERSGHPLPGVAMGGFLVSCGLGTPGGCMS